MLGSQGVGAVKAKRGCRRPSPSSLEGITQSSEAARTSATLPAALVLAAGSWP